MSCDLGFLQGCKTKRRVFLEMASLMLRLRSIQFAWTHGICMWEITLVGVGNRFGKTGRSLQGKTSFNRLRQNFLSLFSSWWTIKCLVTERPKHWLGYSNKVGELNKFSESDTHFKIIRAEILVRMLEKKSPYLHEHELLALCFVGGTRTGPFKDNNSHNSLYHNMTHYLYRKGKSKWNVSRAPLRVHVS